MKTDIALKGPDIPAQGNAGVALGWYVTPLWG